MARRPIAAHLEVVFEDHVADRLRSVGYEERRNADYDRQVAVDVGLLLRFIEATQPDEWARWIRIFGGSAQSILLAEVTRIRKDFGTLHLLKRGVDNISAPRLAVCGFRPASRLVEDLEARFRANTLSFIRQLAYSRRNGNELDLGLFVNGIPVATVELKSQASGQTYQHAEEQYRRDRAPSGEPLLEFRRGALVHFAVDTEYATMTTRLENGRTRFLPFNRGRDGGAGNPDASPGDFRTSYLWLDIWQKDVWLEVLGRFVHLEQSTTRAANGREVRREALIFPRYHQLAAVRAILSDARDHGPGRSYLIQHSAGSGKSNTIAWTAHRLATLHDTDNNSVFDSVVVVTDRVAIDSMLRDKVRALEATPGFVRAIDGTSRDLRRALEEGAKVIVTTIQKFGTQHLQEMTERRGQRFAVIVDEAHSGQSGEAADAMQRALTEEGVALATIEEIVAEAQRARGPQEHLSFLAFTATPRAVTVERFGTLDEGGRKRAFSLYSMRQAIEEGFILDVLANYMTYETLSKIEKAVDDDPLFEGRRGAQRLARAVELHPTIIAQKVAVVVEHFRTHVRHRLDGQAKAMVVTRSREAALRWWQAMRDYIEQEEIGDVAALVAFSGTLTVDGQPWTEATANGFPEDQTAVKFDGQQFNVLLVAEKFQTGFDQPKLLAMYVDKKLAGLQAVQTLSRLNRTCPGKSSVLVLDFENTAEDMRIAFKPYFEATILDGSTNPSEVLSLAQRIRDSGYVDESDVAEFANTLFGPGSDIEKRPVLERLVFRCLDRLGTAEEERRREEFRSLCRSFLRFYSFVAQVWPVADTDLERLHAYLGWVIRMLPPAEGGAPIHLTSDMVRLTALRLKEGAVQDVSLAAGEGGTLPPIQNFGVASWTEAEQRTLSEIVMAFNERHGLNLRTEDTLLLEQADAETLKDPRLLDIIRNNPADVGLQEYEERFTDNAIEAFERNQRFGSAFTKDPAIRQSLSTLFYERHVRLLGEERVGTRIFAELDRAFLVADVAVAGHQRPLPAGTSGTVVGVWAEGKAYEVEFSTPFPCLVTVPAEGLRA